MTAGCEFESRGSGRYALSGELGFENVADLLEQSRAAFDGERRIVVDLAGLTSSDSAALALLIEWLRLARARGAQIVYEGLPSQLLALARISDLDQVFADTAQTSEASQGSSSVSSSSSHSSSSSSGSTGGSPS